MQVNAPEACQGAPLLPPGHALRSSCTLTQRVELQGRAALPHTRTCKFAHSTESHKARLPHTPHHTRPPAHTSSASGLQTPLPQLAEAAIRHKAKTGCQQGHCQHQALPRRCLCAAQRLANASTSAWCSHCGMPQSPNSLRQGVGRIRFTCAELEEAVPLHLQGLQPRQKNPNP